MTNKQRWIVFSIGLGSSLAATAILCWLLEVPIDKAFATLAVSILTVIAICSFGILKETWND